MPTPSTPDHTDATKFLLNAVQYLAMAKLVTETETYQSRPRTYNRPILNTLAIGIELFLKASHIRSGVGINDVAKKYGHDLWKLWRECPEPELIAIVLEEAKQTHDKAVLNGLTKPMNLLSEKFCNALRSLSKLHTVGGSQLRYLAPPDTEAPRPGWLVETFDKVAERSLRRPPFGL